jgi:hypothetical protein
MLRRLRRESLPVSKGGVGNEQVELIKISLHLKERNTWMSSWSFGEI